MIGATSGASLHIQSSQAKAQSCGQHLEPPTTPAKADSNCGTSGTSAASRSASSEKVATSATELSSEEKRKVQALEARDREVRAHEAAHKASAGTLAKGGASFTYETGPDGKRYAVGGEVSIDTSPVANDPEATLRKAQTIQAAALAPAQPSAQDRAVAAEATQMAMEARNDISQQRDEGSETNGEDQGETFPANPGARAYAQAPQSAEDDTVQILNLFA
jgi:hypothetical protein